MVKQHAVERRFSPRAHVILVYEIIYFFRRFFLRCGIFFFYHTKDVISSPQMFWCSGEAAATTTEKKAFCFVGEGKGVRGRGVIAGRRLRPMNWNVAVVQCRALGKIVKLRCKLGRCRRCEWTQWSPGYKIHLSAGRFCRRRWMYAGLESSVAVV